MPKKGIGRGGEVCMMEYISSKEVCDGWDGTVSKNSALCLLACNAVGQLLEGNFCKGISFVHEEVSSKRLGAKRLPQKANTFMDFGVTIEKGKGLG